MVKLQRNRTMAKLQRNDSGAVVDPLTGKWRWDNGKTTEEQNRGKTTEEQDNGKLQRHRTMVKLQRNKTIVNYRGTGQS